MAISAVQPALDPSALPAAGSLRLRAAGALQFTRDQVRKMAEAGLLPPKYELIHGEIISKMAQGIRHRRVVTELFAWALQVWDRSLIQSQASIDLADSDNLINEPEPDLAILKRPLAGLTENPKPEEIELLIEVSDTTLRDDLSQKADLYARAGIPEYWVFDVQNIQIHVHRTPVNGTYRSIALRSANDELAPLSRPEHALTPGQILS